ncbi:Uracil-DNA glycosylase, mitochondrial [Vitis vinifera]|uniref:Uracil-DNA glycosylase, mitochondrial n=1 Tax=Vitis vinifera TaxID=29760 RepID=A0A438CPU6_VITVI|nr:Uracil-DNA glycosylase, mitochondrial [Vitis vinifera]
MGNSAQEKSRLIDDTKHHILKAAHPSGLSANRGFFGCSSNNSAHLDVVGLRVWEGGAGRSSEKCTNFHDRRRSKKLNDFLDRHFSRTNKILEQKGVPPIDWQL